MKTLTLLRHAKSGWSDLIARDFDRPLNGKGRRAAALVGRHLKDSGLAFDRVIASPAVRVVETLDHVSAAYGRTITPEWEKRVYLASAATLLDVVQSLPASASHVLLAGHNPGLEDLVLLLTPDHDNPLRAQAEVKFPTASLATVTFDVDHWGDVAEAGGTLLRFIRPRDLDASLGPDED